MAIWAPKVHKIFIIELLFFCFEHDKLNINLIVITNKEESLLYDYS